MSIVVYGNFVKILENLKEIEKFGSIREIVISPNMENVKKLKDLNIKYDILIWFPKTENLKNGVVNLWNKITLFEFNNSGCINNPEIRKNRLQEIEEYCTKFELNAIVLDAIRFPSPYDGKFLFSCFCTYCIKKANEYGINLLKVKEVLKNNIKELLLTGFRHYKQDVTEYFQEWLKFKTLSVVDLVKEVQEITKKYSVKLYAAIFPLCLSWLLGQSYLELSKYLDEIHVMLYRNCKGPACLNYEYAKFLKLVQVLIKIDEIECREITCKITGIKSIQPIELIENNGIEVETLTNEVKYTISISNKFNIRLVPILWFSVKLPPGLPQ